MAKKRAARRDASAAKPKQLRKRLRKAEDQLGDAVTKRDRAQARVDALSIIADEIRAQLAEVDTAKEARAKSGAAKSKPGAAKSQAAVSAAKTSTTGAAASGASATKKPPAARKPTAAAASRSDTATTRKKPPAKQSAAAEPAE